MPRSAAFRWSVCLSLCLMNTVLAVTDHDFADASPMRPTVVFDITGLTWDELCTAEALQGLVNRRGPRLYLDHGEKADRRWLDIYADRAGLRCEKVASLPDLLRRFRSDTRGVCVYDSDLDGSRYVAIEMKSQVGPSFGNNFNNRAEEAIGSAQDLWTAYREHAFGDSPAPFLGYVFVLEDCEDARKPVGVGEPHFPIFADFVGASYMRRYELLCRKLVLERLYTAAALGTFMDWVLHLPEELDDRFRHEERGDGSHAIRDEIRSEDRRVRVAPGQGLDTGREPDRGDGNLDSRGLLAAPPRGIGPLQPLSCRNAGNGVARGHSILVRNLLFARNRVPCQGRKEIPHECY